MQNFKLIIQYDGTDFNGWQMQRDLRTVQGELTEALSLIEGKDVIVHGSGRTDTGVHAEGQVASVRLGREISAEKLCKAVNGNIANDVRVIDAEAADEEFHARYSAKGKTYVYRIVNGPVISPFWRRFAHLEGHYLDITVMNEAAKLFTGTHDWTAFSAAQSDAETRLRTITNLRVSESRDSRAPGRLIQVTITADGFLRYMVRSIVGTLMAVGRGQFPNELVKQAIVSGDRSLVAATAPASGLTLLSVHYD